MRQVRCFVGDRGLHSALKLEADMQWQGLLRILAGDIILVEPGAAELLKTY